MEIETLLPLFDISEYANPFHSYGIHLLKAARVSCALLFLLSSMQAQQATTQSPPHIARRGDVTQFIVDGKPFVFLAGELHNSSPSSPEYMAPIWDRLQAMHLNSVIGVASWELIEPTEGRFYFDAVDDQIRQARVHGMRLVLIWFGSFKNAGSSYTPLWVKRNPARFPMKLSRNHEHPEWPLRTTDALTVFSEENIRADARAFAALMHHIREVDRSHTIVLVQVENETGVRWDSRDRSPLAEQAHAQQVPDELLQYLAKHRGSLIPEFATIYEQHGARTHGTWEEVFGSGPEGDEIFMAWYTARYIDTVAAAGRRELNLPMYVNAWLVQHEGQTPGDYPSGGPVSRMMDVWQAGAPNIDFVAPDIYLDDFDAVCASYTRSGNPLFIPEARASVPNLFLALGRYNALGYSPFGIDSLHADDPLGQAYSVLGNMISEIAAARTAHRLILVPPAPGGDQTIDISGYPIRISYGYHGPPPPPSPGKNAPPEPVSFLRSFTDSRRGFALILPSGEGSFYIVGSGIAVNFGEHDAAGKVVRSGTIDEGNFVNGTWHSSRRINGDENYGGYRLLIPPDIVTAWKIVLYKSEP